PSRSAALAARSEVPCHIWPSWPEVFGVPKRFQNGTRLLQPMRIRVIAKIALAAFLDDLTIPAVKRISLAPDFLDQLERLLSDLLKAKPLKGLVIKPVDPILFAPVICDFD